MAFLPRVHLILRVILGGAPLLLHAQGEPDTVGVVILADTARYVSGAEPIGIRFSRPWRPSDGTVVLVVGGVDVTALAELDSAGLVYRPYLEALPSGNTSIVVYRDDGREWLEVQRATIKVLTARGFRRVHAEPQSTIGNKGQLVSGESGLPAPDRSTYQDFSFSGSLATTHEHELFTIETATSLVGSSRREEALRYSLRQNAAPRIDLSDYRVSVRAGGTTVEVGHTSFEASRHLVSGFASRGGTLAWTRGGTTVRVAAMGASSTVGWDQLLPVTNPDHRVMALSLGREVLPGRPGALRIDATWLDASMLPRTGYMQGAVLDAEVSDGGAVQMSVSTPGQRLRLTSGASRSRFTNAARDAQLANDTLLVPVEREINTARFVDAAIVPLPNMTLPRIGAVQATINVRHERVDPLYRSVVAPVQADRSQNGADLQLTAGPISAQAGLSRLRDNLAELPNLLTTRDRLRSLNVAVPLAPLLGLEKHARWLPALTWSLNRTHQAGDGVPEGGVFTADQVPDQLSLNRDLGVAWQGGAWRMALRRNRATQDNRQVGRDAADFASGSDAVSLGYMFGATGDIAVDLAEDFQESLERRERSTTRRATVNANIRRGQSTSFLIALSVLRTTPPSGSAALNVDQRIEVTQPLNFLRDASGGARGQVFIRYGRTTARLPDYSLLEMDPIAVLHQRQWNVNSGFNLRLF